MAEKKCEIDDFLNYVYGQLKGRITDDKKAEIFNRIDYRVDGQTPDYTDDLQQKAYLLRYMYGYAFEYEQMYRVALNDLVEKKGSGFGFDTLKILSIGCGSRIDYYGCRLALRGLKKQIAYNKVEYEGVDMVRWADDNSFTEKGFGGCSYVDNEEGRRDKVIFYTNNGGIMEHIGDMDPMDFKHDIIIFPKSISEIDIKDISEIATKIGNLQKELGKPIFYLLSSVRTSVDSNEEDNEKINKFVEIIREKGYECNEVYVPHYEKKQAISGYPDTELKDVKFPADIIKYIISSAEDKNLTEDYDERIEEYDNLSEEERNRYPILKTGQTCFRVLRFTLK